VASVEAAKAGGDQTTPSRPLGHPQPQLRSPWPTHFMAHPDSLSCDSPPTLLDKLAPRRSSPKPQNPFLARWEEVGGAPGSRKHCDAPPRAPRGPQPATRNPGGWGLGDWGLGLGPRAPGPKTGRARCRCTAAAPPLHRRWGRKGARAQLWLLRRARRARPSGALGPDYTLRPSALCATSAIPVMGGKCHNRPVTSSSNSLISRSELRVVGCAVPMDVQVPHCAANTACSICHTSYLLEVARSGLSATEAARGRRRHRRQSFPHTPDGAPPSLISCISI
jgi:hypothetical protein